VNQHHPCHPLDDLGFRILDLALELAASFRKLSPEAADFGPKLGPELGPKLGDLRLERALERPQIRTWSRSPP
jgi:hypothetical protein